MQPRPLTDRFWNKVQRTTGCWLWRGTITPGGYGTIHREGRGSSRVQAHIVSWELHKGAVPAGRFVLHRCDERRCVNPEHLFLGTHEDNMRDMVEKGRQARGSRVNASRLNEEQVRAIRAAHTTGTTAASLARTYGVTPHAVALIVHGVVWKHLT